MQTLNGAALIALVIIAHAWAGRMQSPPIVLSVIAWVINVLAIAALAAVWVR